MGGHILPDESDRVGHVVPDGVLAQSYFIGDFLIAEVFVPAEQIKFLFLSRQLFDGLLINLIELLASELIFIWRTEGLNILQQFSLKTNIVFEFAEIIHYLVISDLPKISVER